MEIFRYLSDLSNAEIVGILPTIEDLKASFPHKNGCSGVQPFEQIAKPVSFGDPRVGSMGVQALYLRCCECNVQREFRAK